jgi:hypothetical protein
MRRASRFKTEAQWTAAVHYLPLAAALLLALVVVTVRLVVRWVTAAG